MFPIFLIPPPPTPTHPPPDKTKGHPPTPTPHLTRNLKKWVSSGGGGLGMSGPKSHWAMHLLDKVMILQGVQRKVKTREFMREHLGGQEDVGVGGRRRRGGSRAPWSCTWPGWCSRAPHGTTQGGWDKLKGFPTTPH